MSKKEQYLVDIPVYNLSEILEWLKEHDKILGNWYVASGSKHGQGATLSGHQKNSLFKKMYDPDFISHFNRFYNENFVIGASFVFEDESAALAFKLMFDK